MMTALYPEQVWYPWNFVKPPRNYEPDQKTWELMILTLEKELSLSKPEDWYRVSRAQLKELGVLSLITKAGGLDVIVSKSRTVHHMEPPM